MSLNDAESNEIANESKRLEGKVILLGVSGSIAAYKAADIASRLVRFGADVYVIMTEYGTRFVGPLTFRSITSNAVLTDVLDEPENHKIIHVDLPTRADLFLIAPATANIIGKLAHGIADDMLTTCALVCRCPMLIAPAMNTNMYSNPVVVANMDHLKNLGYQFVEPESGRLACGTEGVGRLADPEIIVASAIAAVQGREPDLLGISILVTAGPTREPIDPVRYVSNYSSGKMGYAVAEAAARRGAKVTLVSGPTGLEPPVGVRMVPVQTAQEMHDAVMENFADADMVIAAAAVADFAPAVPESRKLKKVAQHLVLELDQTQDILSKLGEIKGKKLLIGFAAETEELEENAKSKLEAKNLDLIVANSVDQGEPVFGSDTNTVTLIARDGTAESWPRMSKNEVANRLLGFIRERLWEERI